MEAPSRPRRIAARVVRPCAGSCRSTSTSAAVCSALFENNALDYIVSDWTTVDLTGLGGALLVNAPAQTSGSAGSAGSAGTAGGSNRGEGSALGALGGELVGELDALLVALDGGGFRHGGKVV